MRFTSRTDFGPDHEPYLRNMPKKKLSVKLLLFPSLLLLVFLAVFYYLNPTIVIMLMMIGCGILVLFSVFQLYGYRLLTFPEDHFIEKKFKTRNFEKLARTSIRKWADKNTMLIRKEAGIHYYYFWYAYPYAPVYFVIKLHYIEGKMYIYYLWPKQYLVASPQHPNLTSPLSLYRVREREKERDISVLRELEKILKLKK